MDFFRLCVGKATYELAMNSEAGKQHYYVAARAFLNQDDWEIFVWIEQHGSLAGSLKNRRRKTDDPTGALYHLSANND